MPEDRILMGVIGRPHGVRGLVHVQSYTADPAALADYGVVNPQDLDLFRYVETAEEAWAIVREWYGVEPG